MALLTIQDLSLGYDSHKIVKDLNFSVNAGDYLCIVGENGSGKTTLMKSLLHLQDPISGQILAKSKRDWISSAADGGSKRFSGIRERDCSLRMPGTLRLASFLQQRRKAAGSRKYAAHGCYGVCEPMLSGTFRRPAAEGTVGQGTLRHKKTIVAG